jgi:hypothetical protein
MHHRINPLAGWKPDSTAVLIASGPSLTPAQIEYIRPRRAFGDLWVGGVNDAYRICPFLDLLYAADEAWWQHHADDLQVAPFTVKACYVPAACEGGEQPPQATADLRARLDLRPIPGLQAAGISLDPAAIHLGQHSGFQLINIAIQAGAKRIALLGFDYRLADDGARHWFGDHPDHLNRDSPYQRFMYELEHAAPGIAAAGVEVINCSPGSALRCFRQARLEDAIE